MLHPGSCELGGGARLHDDHRGRHRVGGRRGDRAIGIRTRRAGRQIRADLLRVGEGCCVDVVDHVVARRGDEEESAIGAESASNRGRNRRGSGECDVTQRAQAVGCSSDLFVVRQSGSGRVPL